MKILTGTIDSTPESRFDLDSVLFFDIETTGLSKEHSHVYLIGCAFKEGGSWKLTQFLAEHIREEARLVHAFYDLAKQYRTLVHFNGTGFDVPYMDFKAEQYGRHFRLAQMENYDILKRARTVKKLLGMQRMSQKEVERFLKIRRDDEMSGGQLIPFFYEYQQTGDARLEEYLLLHNYDDVQGMLKISGVVAYADIPEGKFEVEKVERTESTVTADARLFASVPVPVEKETEDLILAAEGDLLQVVIKPYCGEARYYLEDYKNYYYLPEEDKVIHKVVAQFVDKGHKVKATKNNCYIKKEAVFLPQADTLFEPCFCLPENRRKQLFEAEKVESADAARLKEYLLSLIRNC